ncbi:MAG: hypothetical protein H8E41_03805 [Desulfobulbaceae bacterium]|uniref:Uncharacterized protein n=1 Tax=Candidatus Desulfobia pelagia TaxID=2841692 RepID=A0A8J6NCS6_9BACT|nr:hypothetical protein [Candidatus Desulfobia pelagia]
MSFRSIAFVVGLFSLVMGVLTYNSEVVTAPIPVVSGAVVMLLAAFRLIPELKNCVSCHRKILKKAEQCRYCGARQSDEDSP